MIIDQFDVLGLHVAVECQVVFAAAFVDAGDAELEEELLFFPEGRSTFTFK